MKKILVASILSLLSLCVPAKEIVTLIYPWNLGDPMAHYSRSLIEEANKLQNKYTFILDTRPGAGGAIAANHVLANKNHILATSTAFFVRPNFYPQESHNVNDFRVLMTQCAVPMVISSNKYQKWDQIPKGQDISIGISGLGATSHLVAMEIKKQYPLTQAVPYKSTRDSTLDLVAKRIDLNVGFLGEMESWMNSGKLYALGVTGRKSVNGIPTLMSQGFPQTESIINGHSLIVPAKLPEKTYQEWRDILLKASAFPSVQQSYAVDHCDPLDLGQKQTNQWYQDQIKLWNSLSSKVKKESL